MPAFTQATSAGVFGSGGEHAPEPTARPAGAALACPTQCWQAPQSASVKQPFAVHSLPNVASMWHV